MVAERIAPWDSSGRMVNGASDSGSGNSYGSLYVRSRTYVGREAGLTRFARPTDGSQRQEEAVIDRLMGWRGSSSPNHAFLSEFRGVINDLSALHWIDNVKRWMYILLVRLPRAIQQWHVWSVAAAYGLYHLCKGGHLNRSARDAESEFDGRSSELKMLLDAPFNFTRQARWLGGGGNGGDRGASDDDDDDDNGDKGNKKQDIHVSLRGVNRHDDALADDLRRQYTRRIDDNPNFTQSNPIHGRDF